MERKGSKWITFAIWMRNGIAICFTWLVLLMLIRNLCLGVERIATADLMKLLIGVCGGVLLFTMFFSGIVLKELGFTLRLTGFMLLGSIYESACFYWLGIFTEKGSFRQWILFGGIILILYGISMLIYECYSRKKAAVYTQALCSYQSVRKKEE